MGDTATNGEYDASIPTTEGHHLNDKVKDMAINPKLEVFVKNAL